VINGYESCKEILSSDDWIGRMHEKWQLDRTYKKPLGKQELLLNISIINTVGKNNVVRCPAYCSGAKIVLQVPNPKSNT
jgi:hypothetical protein